MQISSSTPRRAPLPRAALLLAAAIVVAIGSWALRPASVADAPVGDDRPIAAAAPPAVDAPATDGLRPPAERVAFWEGRAADGGGYLDRIHLADAYLDRARTTGDVADLRRAQMALAEAAETAPDLDPIHVREALVAFALHDFAAALATANAVLEADPTDLAALSIAGDSLLELGEVDGAAAHYRELADLAPSAASWSRLGRMAFLRGDARSAISLVGTAAADAVKAGFPDEIAFYHVQLGDLHRMRGGVADAEAAYMVALDALPDHVPAIAGLARVREAQGRRDEAIALLESAVDRLPQPELVAALGDLRALAGDANGADAEYALVEAVAGLSEAGPIYDRAYVLFAADHRRELDEAVERAEADLETRGDVYGYDALAWALFAAGRLSEAAVAADQATRLGTPDPRIAYHAGLIAAAMGRDAEARRFLEVAVAGAAALPPLQVPRAQDALAALGAGAAP
jgi:tetratricopeptide (TPR) repeat protein